MWCGFFQPHIFINTFSTAFLMIVLLPIKCKFPGPNLSPYDGIVNTAGSLDQTYCLLCGEITLSRTPGAANLAHTLSPSNARAASELKLSLALALFPRTQQPGGKSNIIVLLWPSSPPKELGNPVLPGASWKESLTSDLFRCYLTDISHLSSLMLYFSWWDLKPRPPKFPRDYLTHAMTPQACWSHVAVTGTPEKVIITPALQSPPLPPPPPTHTHMQWCLALSLGGPPQPLLPGPEMIPEAGMSQSG